jgi:two-component system, sensor histidine kinase PdtaS
VAESLMLAMVASSDVPLLLLGGDLDVIAVSNSFGAAFEVETINARGHSVFKLGSGERDTPKLRSVLGVTLSGHAAIEAYEMDLFGHGKVRRLVIKAKACVRRRRLTPPSCDGL